LINFMPKQNNKSQKKVVQKEEEDHQIKETKATKAAQKKKTQPVVEESDGDDSQYYDGEEEGDITHPLNDPELNDDIYIPKKKTKKNNGEEAVTKKTNATKEIKAEGKRKGQAQKQPEPEPESEEEDVDEVEEDDDIVVEEQKESKKQQKKKNKAERFANQNKEATEVDIRGVVYVGHLPYGLEEDGLRGYFSQYGEILNLSLARSHKSARSMGYAFIEFKNREVAKIAAENMNGYMLYGKKLDCRLIEDDPNLKVKSKRLKFIPFPKNFHCSEK